MQRNSILLYQHHTELDLTPPHLYMIKRYIAIKTQLYQYGTLRCWTPTVWDVTSPDLTPLHLYPTRLYNTKLDHTIPLHNVTKYHVTLPYPNYTWRDVMSQNMTLLHLYFNSQDMKELYITIPRHSAHYWATPNHYDTFITVPYFTKTAPNSTPQYSTHTLQYKRFAILNHTATTRCRTSPNLYYTTQKVTSLCHTSTLRHVTRRDRTLPYPTRPPLYTTRLNITLTKLKVAPHNITGTIPYKTSLYFTIPILDRTIPHVTTLLHDTAFNLRNTTWPDCTLPARYGTEPDITLPNPHRTLP